MLGSKVLPCSYSTYQIGIDMMSVMRHTACAPTVGSAAGTAGRFNMLTYDILTGGGLLFCSVFGSDGISASGIFASFGSDFTAGLLMKAFSRFLLRLSGSGIV